MLEEVRLSNYRKFEDHVVPFRDVTLLVGANNAGKSTVIEALRIISYVIRRREFLTFRKLPAWVTDPLAGPRGVSPSLRDTNINLSTVFHAFSAPPATISAQFSDGSSVNVYFGPGGAVFATLRGPTGKPITGRGHAASDFTAKLAVQPLVGPLVERERVLDPETIRRGRDTTLNPLHFRNQLATAPGDYDRFARLAEESWPSIKVEDLLGGTPEADHLWTLLIRDGPFVGEVAQMGHGLQMWLQIIWFLCRVDPDATVVLDEPDVYMHPDLQRRLVRMLVRTNQQLIVATHSVEIMSEVPAAGVLVVDAEQPASRWADDVAGVQAVIGELGSIHNLQLAKLAQARKCLFVEGKDIAILKLLHDTAFPGADSLASIPSLEVGGWSGWQRAIGAAEFMTNSAGELLTSYCIFDSDYHLDEEIEERLDEARTRGIQLTIWTLKEIENYLLQPEAIHRVLIRKNPGNLHIPALAQVVERLEEVVEELAPKVTDGYATEFQKADKTRVAGTCSRMARDHIAAKLASGAELQDRIPGKKAISLMSRWASDRRLSGFNAIDLAAELHLHEIPGQVLSVLEAVEQGDPLTF